MKSWSIGTRFTLAIAIFSIPIVVMIYYIWRTSQDVVDFSLLEQTGIERLQAGTKLKGKSFEFHFRVYGPQKPSAEEWKALGEEWTKYIDSLKDLKVDRKLLSESLEAYINSSDEEKMSGGRFLTTLRDFGKIREAIADNHNIMLDPDSDSYYTMDLVITLIPRLIELYGEMGQVISSTDPELIDMGRGRLDALQPSLEDVIRRIIAGLAKVKEFDEAYYGRMERYQSNYGRYDASVREQLKLAYGIFSNVDVAIKDKRTSIKTMQMLFNASEELSDNLYEDFSGFISRRIEVQKSEMFRKCGIAVFTLLIAILFSAYLGKSINETIKTFKNAVNGLQTQASTALSIGQTLIEASSEVSDAASKQAAVIEETSASLEELTSIVNINSENSQSARTLAIEAQNHATTGSSEMEHLMANMEKITNNSREIENIMNLIDDIAFQTNLLALNAAVEAARAGDHGKGFAVVAEAVRSLAQKSASSAKQISDLIKNSLTDIKDGQESAVATNEVMSKILKTVEKVSHLNDEIANASKEQSMGISSIGKAMTELEQSTIQNSTIAKNTTEHSEKALVQAENLNSIVAVLDLELQGKKVSGSDKKSAA